MYVKLKSLVGKLNDTCRKSLDAAAGFSVARTNYDLEIEHWLFKLNEIPNTDFQRVLRYFVIEQKQLSHDLSRVLDQLKTGNTRTPALSPYIVRWLNGTWLFASIDFDSDRIRSSHLLLAALADEELVQTPGISSTRLKQISVEVLHEKLLEIVKGSDEDTDNSEKPTPLEVETANSNIFISYRRDDTAGWARSLYDRLSQQFSKQNVFIDIDNLEPGLEFAEEIKKSVASCRVMIALIGRSWLSSVDDTGQRRLDNPKDFVRLEITAALERKIRVIPVLLQGCQMPRAKDLPDDLKSLADRNAHKLDETHFDNGVTKLIEVMRRDLRNTKNEPSN